MKHGTWRIKGIIQVSRSIGDAYLKRPEFALDSSYPRSHLPDPICRPVLSVEPSMSSRIIQPNDKFLIFASDGLWDHMTNQEAADIVYNNPRTVASCDTCSFSFFCASFWVSHPWHLADVFLGIQGIARRLARVALNEAARKREMRWKDMQKVGKGIRRFFHDDISVVVIFTDHELHGKKMTIPELSIRGFVDKVGPSNLKIVRK